MNENMIRCKVMQKTNEKMQCRMVLKEQYRVLIRDECQEKRKEMMNAGACYDAK
jgi:hypothetical protein